MSNQKEIRLTKISFPIQNKKVHLDIIQYYEKKKYDSEGDDKQEGKKYKKKNKANNLIRYIRSYCFIFLLLNIFDYILLNHRLLYFRNLNYSYILLKIKGTGYREIFCKNTENFAMSYYPDEIYINGDIQETITLFS